MMVNWEFFDNMTPDKALALVDDILAGKDVKPSRGADTVASFKQVSRVLAGFTDGRADEDQGAGVATLAGLEFAKHGAPATPPAAAPATPPAAVKPARTAAAKASPTVAAKTASTAKSGRGKK